MKLYYFYYLQGIALSSLISGFSAENEWTLNSQFKFVTLDPILLLKIVCHPDKLFDLRRGELILLVKTTNQDNKSTGTNSSDEQTITSEIKDEPIKIQKALSQKSLATKIIIDNDIVLVPQMGTFMVKG